MEKKNHSGGLECINHMPGLALPIAQTDCNYGSAHFDLGGFVEGNEPTETENRGMIAQLSINALTCIIHDSFEKYSKALVRDKSSDLPEQKSSFCRRGAVK